MPKKILYCEGNVDGTIGGSHFSLLYLIENLNKDLYFPLVIFYQENRLIPRFKDAGCKTLILHKPRPFNFLKLFPQIKNFSKYPLLHLCIVKPFLILQKIINYFVTFIFPSFTCWKIIRKENVDLIHLNNTLLRPQEWILASLFTKAKIIAHERGINTSFPFQTRFWSRFLKAIICISDAVKNNLIKEGFPKKKLFRIYNALDLSKVAVTKAKQEILYELGIENDCPIVGIVGNIKEWKGQETVIRSMRHIRQDFPTLKCLIVGAVSTDQERYFLQIQDIVKKENLDDCVIFTGQRSDVPDLINILQILVHASIAPEPFGRVILEGMALRKPVIATNIGAPPEILVAGKTGLLVPPGEPELLAHAVMTLLSNSELATEMGEAGYVRLLKEFTLRKNVQQIEALYYRILGS